MPNEPPKAARDGPGRSTLLNRLAKVSARAWVAIALAVVLVAAGIVGIYWAYGSSPEALTVEEEWDAAITELGVEPVYPPEEDVEVGDVFAIVTYDAKPQFGVIKSALANHAVRLWRLHLSHEIDDNYRDTYVFPVIASRTAEEQAAAASQPIFTLVDHRNDLPIVTFPRFHINMSKGAKFGGSASTLGALGAEGNSNAEMEVSITKTQTYGIPALVAQNALYNFCLTIFSAACTDTAARTALSIRIGRDVWGCSVVDKVSQKKEFRMKVEVGLINRVFLTSAIETRLIQARGLSGEATSETHTPTLSSPPATARTAAALPKSRNASAPDAALTASDSATESSQFAVLFDGKPLDRPVVFGFESVRYTPQDSDLTKCLPD
jgi:hypothetical protein